MLAYYSSFSDVACPYELFDFVILFSRILIYYDGVEMAFEMDSSLPHFKGNKKGRIYLTTHRVNSNASFLYTY